MSRVGDQRHRKDRVGKIEPATDPGGRKEFDRELAEVRHQSRQRIVPRVEQPDNFVDGPERLGCAPRERLQMALYIDRLIELPMRQLAQDGELREPRADVIMNVVGDAVALLFQGQLAAKVFKTPHIAQAPGVNT